MLTDRSARGKAGHSGSRRGSMSATTTQVASVVRPCGSGRCSRCPSRWRLRPPGNASICSGLRSETTQRRYGAHRTGNRSQYSAARRDQPQEPSRLTRCGTRQMRMSRRELLGAVLRRIRRRDCILPISAGDVPGFEDPDQHSSRTDQLGNPLRTSILGVLPPLACHTWRGQP